MIEPRRRRTRSFAAVGALVGVWLGACRGDPCTGGFCIADSPTRLLDEACGRPTDATTCVTTGDAAATSGPTDDTRGYRFGPEGGDLVIPLDTLDDVAPHAGDEDTFIEALVAVSDGADRGTVQTTMTVGACPCGEPPAHLDLELTGGYRWVTIYSGVPSSGARADASDRVLTISATSVDLADLRVSATTRDTGCSIGMRPQPSRKQSRGP